MGPGIRLERASVFAVFHANSAQITMAVDGGVRNNAEKSGFFTRTTRWRFIVVRVLTLLFCVDAF